MDRGHPPTSRWPAAFPRLALVPWLLCLTLFAGLCGTLAATPTSHAATPHMQAQAGMDVPLGLPGGAPLHMAAAAEPDGEAGRNPPHTPGWHTSHTLRNDTSGATTVAFPDDGICRPLGKPHRSPPAHAPPGVACR